MFFKTASCEMSKPTDDSRDALTCFAVTLMLGLMQVVYNAGWMGSVVTFTSIAVVSGTCAVDLHRQLSSTIRCRQICGKATSLWPPTSWLTSVSHLDHEDHVNHVNHVNHEGFSEGIQREDSNIRTL
jgi:hypothetical protein